MGVALAGAHPKWAGAKAGSKRTVVPGSAVAARPPTPEGLTGGARDGDVGVGSENEGPARPPEGKADSSEC